MNEEGTIVRKGTRSFAQVPDDLVIDVSGHAVRVWARLDRYAGRVGGNMPSRAALANDLGLSEATVKRALADLMTAGWITRRRIGSSNTWETQLNEERVTGDPSTSAKWVTGDPVMGHGRPGNGSRVTRPRKKERGEERPTTAPPADAVDPAGTEELDLGLPPAPAVRNPVQVLVGAYSDAVKARGGIASRSLLGAIGKAVKRLVDEGVPEPVLLDVVVLAAAKGRRDLDAILAAPNGPLSAFERRQDARDRMFARWHEVAERLDGRTS